MKVVGGVISTFVVLAILFFIFCVRTVDAGQVGIIRRFGEVNRVAPSGMVVKMPWPFEKLTKMDIRIQKEEQDSSAATSDLQDVNAKLVLNYQITNGSALKVFKELNNDYKERVVVPAVQESFKAASANYTAKELVTKRSEVKDNALAVVKARLEKYGIEVIDLSIVNFSFSQEYSKAIEDVQVAQQKVEQAKQQLQQAKIDAERKVTQAEADARSQAKQKETLTPELLQKYAIDKWNGVLPSTYGGGGFLFNIPIKK